MKKFILQVILMWSNIALYFKSTER